jgi:hypothetical protein
LVAEVKTHEQQEVTTGSETQAEADAKVAAAKDRITAIVNGQMPPFPGRDHDREGGSTPTTTPTTQTN